MVAGDNNYLLFYTYALRGLARPRVNLLSCLCHSSQHHEHEDRIVASSITNTVQAQCSARLLTLAKSASTIQRKSCPWRQAPWHFRRLAIFSSSAAIKVSPMVKLSFLMQ